MLFVTALFLFSNIYHSRRKQKHRKKNDSICESTSLSGPPPESVAASGAAGPRACSKPCQLVLIQSTTGSARDQLCVPVATVRTTRKTDEKHAKYLSVRQTTVWSSEPPPWASVMSQVPTCNRWSARLFFKDLLLFIFLFSFSTS